MTANDRAMAQASLPPCGARPGNAGAEDGMAVLLTYLDGSARPGPMRASERQAGGWPLWPAPALYRTASAERCR